MGLPSSMKQSAPLMSAINEVPTSGSSAALVDATEAATVGKGGAGGEAADGKGDDDPASGAVGSAGVLSTADAPSAASAGWCWRWCASRFALVL
jgi:hypothetical protein